MNHFLFGLGGISFLVLLGLIMYWVFIEDAEDYFYRSVICSIGMSVLVMLLFKFRDSIFNEKIIKRIIIFAVVIIILSIIIYIWRFIFDSINDFELRLLIFLIPIGISVYPFILLVFPNGIKSVFSLSTTDIASTIVYSVSFFVPALITVFISVLHRVREQSLKSELRKTQRLLRYNYLDRNLLKNDFSKSDLLEVEEVVTRLYLMAQNDIPSTLETLGILEKNKISSSLLHIIMDRLYSEKLINRCSFMTLTEFQQELLPEIFSLGRVYRSSSMDMRYYEDFTERIRYVLKNDNRALDELSQRIDSLNQKIEKSMLSDANNTKSTEIYGCQNQIRELFHALETPIATSEMAITNLVASFDLLTKIQKEKFIKIQNNIKLIKSILFAYRELTFMNVYSSENTFFSLPVIINSIQDIGTFEMDNFVTLEQQGIPDNIPQYSTNLIVVLILPLIHNAIEASPSKKTVIVNYTQCEMGYTIQIENYCKQTPRQKDLDTDGYSSKGNNHVGTGISIVRRISRSVGVDFYLKVNNNKVIAQLIFPKQ